MKNIWIEDSVVYTGEQLRSLYNYLEHDLLGDSIVAWIGPCDVSRDHMVDGEDLKAFASIKADQMLHFIIEIFDQKLFTAVITQRLFASIVMEALKEFSTQKSITNVLIRDGDDIFFKEQKLNVSIATQSPISSLIHFGINVINEGTPVPTLSLTDLKVNAKDFALLIMSKFQNEVQSMKDSACKVIWVR